MLGGVALCGETIYPGSKPFKTQYASLAWANTHMSL